MIKMEEWKDVIGYEGLYVVSSKGKVKSLGKGNSTNTLTKHQRILTQREKNNGYLHVKLYKFGIRRYMLVHRLVAKSFLENRLNKPEVNHKDGNKKNNNLENLEWSTTSENLIHSFKTGLRAPLLGVNNKQSKPVLQLNKNGTPIKIWDSIGQIRRDLGFNTFGIIKCCKKQKRYKTAYGFKWEYYVSKNVSH